MRTVHQGDALAWLREHDLPDDSAILTSLPNVDEFSHRDFARWREWFVDAAELVIRKTPASSAAVFFQTDIQHEGAWVDKSHLLQLASERTDARLLWHKIAMRAPHGTTTNERPGYAHLLCFSQTLERTRENATPDVLPRLGEMPWTRAIGVQVTRATVQWLREHARATTIVDPFCGVGTVLAVANEQSLAAIGIELHKGRSERARALRLRPEDTTRPNRQTP